VSGVSCGSATNCMAVGTWTISQEPVQRTIASGGTASGGLGPPLQATGIRPL
jgi:hypothetical protein